ncbi:MAG: D-alanyl-D-alanine carboxypeptidase family protein, partial [Pseudomonadota bacterium]
DTTARAALVIDYDTGTVLLEKNADALLPPASMSKLMTLYMVFEALDQGRLALSDTYRVSTKASQMGGSKMFLRDGETVSIEDLIRGIIVQSGNDACVVVAEGMAGSESAFANRMTRRARELGMMNSTFANATGWPHPDHLMSTKDLATLAMLLIREFPQYYPYFAETVFTWDGITQENRNPLLPLDLGADGLKTGHTEEAGFGLVGSAEQDGRRLITVVTGLNTARDRLVESERLLTWGFREFTTSTLFAGETEVAQADVWLGTMGAVPLVTKDPLTAVIAFQDQDKLQAHVHYTGPIEAPISKGDAIAQLVVTTPEIGETRYDLYAGADVPRGGFMSRFRAAAQVLSSKALETAFGSATPPAAQ